MEEKYINQIIRADCLDFMKQLPDKCIDLVLTDPPYGLGMAARGRIGTSRLGVCRDYGKSDWDNSIPTSSCFDEIKRVSHQQIIWGGNYFTNVIGKATHWIYWDKDNFDNDFSDGELAWTSFNLTSVRRFKYRWAGMLQEPDHIKEDRIHPTQKPLALMLWLIERYTNPQDLILDPFCGSGTTCVAAEQLGRKWIGIEISEAYCEIARDRIKAVRTGVPVKEARNGQMTLLELPAKGKE